MTRIHGAGASTIRWRKQKNLILSRSLGAALLILSTALLAGCVRNAGAIASADPADAEAPVPAVKVRSAIAPYTSRRPVEPSSWRELNERVAPAPKQ